MRRWGGGKSVERHQGVHPHGFGDSGHSHKTGRVGARAEGRGVPACVAAEQETEVGALVPRSQCVGAAGPLAQPELGRDPRDHGLLLTLPCCDF